MNQKIVDYLQQYKKQYSKADLVKQLSKSGYDKKDIDEGVAFIYKDSYNTSKNNKVVEFISGVIFGSVYIIIIGYIINKLFHILFSTMDKMDEINELIVILLEIIATSLPFLGIGIFIWLTWWLIKRKHKKYIAFGMLFGVVAIVLVVVLGFATALLAMILGG